MQAKRCFLTQSMRLIFNWEMQFSIFILVLKCFFSSPTLLTLLPYSPFGALLLVCFTLSHSTPTRISLTLSPSLSLFLSLQICQQEVILRCAAEITSRERSSFITDKALIMESLQASRFLGTLRSNVAEDPGHHHWSWWRILPVRLEEPYAYYLPVRDAQEMIILYPGNQSHLWLLLILIG